LKAAARHAPRAEAELRNKPKGIDQPIETCHFPWKEPNSAGTASIGGRLQKMQRLSRAAVSFIH
jgi:hypothetical protein